MKCPSCGKSNLVKGTKTVRYEYKGKTLSIKNVRGEFCGSCDDYILEPKEASRVSKLMLAFNKQVNSKKVDPKYITSVRKKLSLGQKEAGKLFGGGVNAFSRYENGKAIPPVALVHLLRVLDKHPKILGELVK